MIPNCKILYFIPDFYFVLFVLYFTLQTDKEALYLEAVEKKVLYFKKYKALFGHHVTCSFESNNISICNNLLSHCTMQVYKLATNIW